MFLKKINELLLQVRLKTRQLGFNISRLALLGAIGAGVSIVTFQNCARYAANPSGSGVVLSSTSSTTLSGQAPCLTPDGQSKRSGESFSFAKSPNAGTSGCQYLARVCSNGQWLGDASYSYGQCAEADKSCSFDGNKIPNGGYTSALYYKSDKAALGKTCADSSNASKLKCVEGAMQSLATYPYSSCHEGCTLNGIIFQHGDVTVDFFFKQATVTSGTCSDNGNASQLICMDGQMKPKNGGTGSYVYSRCTVASGTGTNTGTGNTTGTGTTTGTGSGTNAGGAMIASSDPRLVHIIRYYFADKSKFVYTAIRGDKKVSIYSDIQKSLNKTLPRDAFTETPEQVKAWFDPSLFTFKSDDIIVESIINLRDEFLLAQAKQFNPVDYGYLYADSKSLSIRDREDHFNTYGAYEQRSPNVLFNVVEYSNRNRKVMEYFNYTNDKNGCMNAVSTSGGSVTRSLLDITKCVGVYKSYFILDSTPQEISNYFSTATSPSFALMPAEVAAYAAQKSDFYIQFDEHAYLFNPNNIDVLNAMIRKSDTGLSSGLVHYLKSGRTEVNRPPALVPLAAGGGYRGAALMNY